MKIVSVVGARPQFIKSAPVTKVISEAGYFEYKIHTGQHYDYDMSQVFFEELGLAEPSINLGIGSGTHANQTGQMMMGIESIFFNQNPDIVLVYGDTNSTLAGALTAAKLNIRLAHIEAGLRSFNRQMPEELNRILTDHCSSLLFCPTQTAVDNLAREGIRKGVHLVGDTMYDAVLMYGKIAEQKSNIFHALKIKPKDYLLATIHRAHNVDHPEVLSSILSAFHQVDQTIIFPIHPRTLYAVKAANLPIPANVKTINPVGYLDMLVLEKNACIIVTDSGGMQKEAFYFNVPCLTLRSETEWVETIENGCNLLVGTDTNAIVDAIKHHKWPTLSAPPLYGDGHTSHKIISILNLV